jgi:sugar O-acyltransferase (sialic acid O-acetyltransferase NeuD family)
MEEVILVGNFIEILELCEIANVKICGVFDRNHNNSNSKINYIGNDESAKLLYSDYHNKAVIITPDFPEIRNKLGEYYKGLGYKFYTLISPLANISKSASIGEGCVIQSLVNISSEVEIGRLVKVNSCANIMHNCKIGDNSTIAPNTVILGNVTVGQNCYLGANSTILPNISIADGVIIGAGAVVTKNIEEKYTVFAGVPARKLNTITK